MKIIIKNIATEYLDEGSGPIMLFLHGWKDNLHTFDSLVSIFSKQQRIIRIDLPGFGNSELPQTIWRLDDYVQFIKDFIDKLNIQVDVLVGHSFGGRIAIKAIGTGVIKPKKLILIASAGIAKIQTIRNCLFYIFAKVGKIITLLPPFIFWRKQLQKKLYDIAGSDYFLSGKLKNTFLNIIKEDLKLYASKIIIPTLIIWGDRDKTTPLKDGQCLSKIICNSRLKIIDGAGHFVHQENPQKVAELFSKFIFSTPLNSMLPDSPLKPYRLFKNWLSHYSWRYVRSLTYMLQTTEYNIRDYLKWYIRTKNFNKVEHRKHLVKTPKAILIFIIFWTILLTLYSSAIFLFWFNQYIFTIGILLTTPYLLAYGIIVPIFLIKIFQLPIEFLIIQKAKQKLKKHKAIKIAIAGSFGKTTMREILKTVLSEGKKTAAPSRNYNTPLGISQFIKALKGDEEILIFEFGEYYPKDIYKLCCLVQPQIGIITGINEAHLEKFKSLDKTIKTIFELSDWLGKNLIYVNGESDLVRKNALNNHIVYNRKGIGKWKVKNSQTNLNGTNFILSKDEQNEQNFEIKTKLLGLHQIGPLIVAADIAIKLGMSMDQVKEGIKKIEPFEHRLEPKIDNAGIITLDDSYNGNPDGTQAVIEFLSSLHNYRRFYVTPGLVEMGTRTETVHYKIGIELAKAGIEKIILIKNSATPFIAKGLEDANYKGEIIWFDDALVAFSALPRLTAKGDVVLLQNDWPDQYQ